MTQRRRTLIATGIGATLVVAFIASLLAFGIKSVPSFPPAASANDPAPSGYIAVTQAKYGDNGESDHETCASVIDVRTSVAKQLICRPVMSLVISWLSDGRLVVATPLETTPLPGSGDPSQGDAAAAGRTFVFDVAGNPLPALAPNDALRVRFDSPTTYPDTQYQSDYQRAAIVSDDGHTLVSAEGPQNYFFELVASSPRNDWLAVRDSENRLLITSVAKPKLFEVAQLRTSDDFNVAIVAWYQPGEKANTFDLATPKPAGVR